jgi:hypothetical protein
MNGRLVGQLADVLSQSSLEEKVSALALTVDYFTTVYGIDMEKFHALLVLCDAHNDGAKLTTGYSGPPVEA